MSRSDYGVLFDGRSIVHPGAYDSIDANSMVSSTPGSLNLPIVIGEANCGKSGEVKWFSSAPVARKYLGGGELATALDLMFSPKPEGGGGASTIGVLITNSTTQATLTQGGMAITSQVYGDAGNKIQVQLQNGTISNTKKFIAYRWDTAQSKIFDDLGAVIQIQYMGTSAYAGVTVTVDGVSKKATTLEIKVGADSATAVTDLLLDLTDSQYSTLDSLVKFIASNSNYDANCVSFRNGDLLSSSLDAVVGASIKAKNYLYAMKADIEAQVNATHHVLTCVIYSNTCSYRC
jgi:hypothetical protein